MDDAVGVAELQGKQELVNDFFNLDFCEGVVFEILFEVAVTVFEN